MGEREEENLYTEAIALRRQGWSVGDIGQRLGIARSTAWLWVRHLPLDRTTARARAVQERGNRARAERWVAKRAERRAHADQIGHAAAAVVGRLDERDLVILGAVMYWCEGSKAKPWRPGERLVFTNSDPGLIRLFLRFLEVVGVSADRIHFRVAIHESADAEAAVRKWATVVGNEPVAFLPTTLKRHTPTTRHNKGHDYAGCLVVTVSKSRELYWQVEGIVRRLVAEHTSEPG